jgi:hypothetical protein
MMAEERKAEYVRAGMKGDDGCLAVHWHALKFCRCGGSRVFVLSAAASRYLALTFDVRDTGRGRASPRGCHASQRDLAR